MLRVIRNRKGPARPTVCSNEHAGDVFVLDEMEKVRALWKVLAQWSREMNADVVVQDPRPQHPQAQSPADRAFRPIGGDHVPAAHIAHVASRPITDLRGDSFAALFETKQLSPEKHLSLPV